MQNDCRMCDNTGRRYMEGTGWVQCPEIWRHQGCEACNAEAGEPCRFPCTAHAQALEEMSRA